jgi:hypothetical protein
MRRQAGVEPQLLLAKEMPPLRGGEIEETQIHRFLQFVGIISRQEDMGYMGFDMLHPRHWVRIGPWEPQSGDQWVETGHSLLLPALTAAVIRWEPDGL